MSRFLLAVALAVSAGAGYMVGETAATHRRSAAHEAAEARWQTKLAEAQAQAVAVEQELREENKKLADRLDEAGNDLSAAVQQHLKDIDATERKSLDALQRAEHEAVEAKRALREAEIAASERIDEINAQLEKAQAVAENNYDVAMSLQEQRDDALAANREWAQTSQQVQRNAYGASRNQVVGGQASMPSPETQMSGVIGGQVHNVMVNGRPVTVVEHDDHTATIMGPGGRSATATTMGNTTYINGGIHNSDR